MPDNNLDPEQLQAFNHGLQEISRILEIMGAIMGSTGPQFKDLTRRLNMLSASAGGSATGFDRHSNSLAANSAALDSNSATAKEQAKAAKAREKAWREEYEAQRRYGELFKGAGNSVLSFGNAALSAGTNLTRFSGTVDQFGRTLSSFASTFGTVGKVVGLAVEAYTFVTKKTLEYADNLLAAKDDLADFGAVGKLTSGQIFQFGKDAGYTSINMKDYAKAVKSLGTDIISLSGTVNGGVEEFAKLAKMTDEQRINYQAMGWALEDVTKGFADFIKLQNASGRVITEQQKRDGTLKKAMEEYIVNINELTSITGLQRDQAKDLMTQATSQWQFQLKMIELGEKRLKIEERLKDTSLTPPERKELEREKEAINKRENDSRNYVTEMSNVSAVHGAVAARLIATEGRAIDSQMALMSPSGFKTNQEIINGTYKAGAGQQRALEDLQSNYKMMGGSFGLAAAPANAALIGADQSRANRLLGARMGLKDMGMGEVQGVANTVAGAVAGTTPNKTADTNEKLRDEMIVASLEIQRKLDVALGKNATAIEALVEEMKKMAGVIRWATEHQTAIQYGLMGLGAAILGKFAWNVGTSVKNGVAAGWEASKNLIDKFGPGKKPLPSAAEKVVEGVAETALPVATKVAEGGAAAVKPGFLMTAEEKIAERAARQAADAAKLAGAESTTLGKMAGPMGKVSKVAGKLAVPLAVAGGVYQAATGYNEAADEERAGKITHAEGNVKKGGAIGEGAGTATGGIVGAVAGQALIPIPVVGALIGGIVGSWVGGKLGKEVGKVGGDLLTDKDKKDKESDKDVNMKLTGSFVEMTKVTLAFTKALKEASDSLGGLTNTKSGGTAGGGTAGGGGAGRGGGDATGSTSGNGQTAMEKAIAAGYTKEQAAGLVGNLQQESGMNPTARNEREGAQGIAQWRGERLEAFKKKYGKEVMYATLDEQMDFVLHELETTEKKAGNLLKNAKTAAEAAAIVDKFYERSAGTELAKRVANANAIAGKQAIDAANAAATNPSVAQAASASKTDEAKPPVAQAVAATKTDEATPPVATAVPAKEEPIITITPTAEFKETGAANANANTPGKSVAANAKKKKVAPERPSGDKGGSAGINLATPGASSEGNAGEAEANPEKTGFAAKVKSILSMIDLSPKEARLDGKGTPSPAYPIKVTVPKSDENESAAETARLARFKKRTGGFYGDDAVEKRAAAKKEREDKEASATAASREAARVAGMEQENAATAADNQKHGENRRALPQQVASAGDIDPKTLLPRTQKLAKGGIVSNTSSGSMVTLGDGPPGHKEAAIPLDPSSIVHKLIQPGSAETLNKATDTMPIPAPVASPMSDMSSGLTVEMVEMLSQKLDTMIDKLSSGNDTQDKILMYSRA